MNLFILDRNPIVCASYYNDSHCRKIILEAIEMMGYAYDNGTFEPWPWIHKHNRHKNHPITKWVRQSRQHFDWTIQHAYALCEEFYFRFGKEHKCKQHLDWIAMNLPLANLPDVGFFNWPRCFGTFHDIVGETPDVVYDYRRYYMIGKRHLARWTRRDIPFWYK